MEGTGEAGVNVPIFLVAFFIADGLGWILGSRYADERRRFLVVGCLTLAAGCLFTISFLGWVGGITESSAITWTLLGVAAFFPGAVLRVFMWKHDWEPARRVQARIGRRRPHYDKLESIIISIVFLISVSSLGRGVFVGPSQYYWHIAGGISAARTYDIAAAAGIASSQRVRLISLWTARASVIAAVVLRVAAWA